MKEAAKKNLRLVLEYDGSRYDGWQKQGNTGNTIQGRLEQVLERMTGQPAEVQGSGRTDGGVHALGQVANAHIATDLRPEEIFSYVNRYLPEDIRVLQADFAPERFHSRLNAEEKTYRYVLDTAPKTDVFRRRYVWTLGEALDGEAMERTARLLCGTHDFRGFSTKRPGKKSTVRTLRSLEIHSRGTCLEFEFCGDGFLYHMVRILMGTLVEAGQGKRTPESVLQVFETGDRSLAGFTAPAKGLFLVSVSYPDFRFPKEEKAAVPPGKHKERREGL